MYYRMESRQVLRVNRANYIFETPDLKEKEKDTLLDISPHIPWVHLSRHVSVSPRGPRPAKPWNKS